MDILKNVYFNSIKKTAVLLANVDPSMLDARIINNDLTDDEVTKKLTGTLILCNHDAAIIDIACVPLFLRRYNVPLTIVIHGSNYFNGECAYTDLAEKYDVKLIPAEKSREKIIDEINSGRSVLLFYTQRKYHNIENNKSLKIIVDQTKCKPVLLFYKLDFKYTKTNIHPRLHNFLYSIKTFVVGKSMKKRNESVKMEVDLKFTDSYDDMIKHKSHFRSLFLH